MEERWLPLLYLLGALVGYGLFMRTQPRRAAFGTGLLFARNNLTLVLWIATLLVANVLWQFTQQSVLSTSDQLILEVTQWSDLGSWVPLITQDLRSVFWYAVPLDIAFLLGTPIALLSTWYWIPRVWQAVAPGKHWIAGIGYGLFVLSLWWWSHRFSLLTGWNLRPIPDILGLHQILRGVAEIAFAVLLACFFQMVLVLGAYRSHDSGAGNCRLLSAFSFGFKCFERLLPIQLICLAGITMDWIAGHRLSLQSGSVWDGIKLFTMLVLGTVPMALLLLEDGRWSDSIRSGLRFLGQTCWNYLWFAFIALVHFLLLRMIESYLLTSILTTEISVLIWHVSAAILRAFLVVWLVNAFCLYFCIEVSQLGRSKKKPKTKKTSLKLATLHARIQRKRRFPLR